MKTLIGLLLAFAAKAGSLVMDGLGTYLQDPCCPSIGALRLAFSLFSHFLSLAHSFQIGGLKKSCFVILKPIVAGLSPPKTDDWHLMSRLHQWYPFPSPSQELRHCCLSFYASMTNHEGVVLKQRASQVQSPFATWLQNRTCSFHQHLERVASYWVVPPLLSWIHVQQGGRAHTHTHAATHTHTHIHLYDRSLLLCDCRQLNQSCMITAKWEVRKRYFLKHSWVTWLPNQPQILVMH